MFKRALLCSVLLFISTGVMAADGEADAAAGVWQTASGGYVQLYESNGEWIGKIVGSRSGEARYDENNPDEDKRGRRLLGVKVLKGLEYAGNGEYEGGEIYDPNNGKSYKAKGVLKDPDTLDVRGYIGISLIGKSQTWTRVDPDSPNVHQELLEDGGKAHTADAPADADGEHNAEQP